MAKVQIKSEKLTPFGGIFSIIEQLDSMLSPIIDQTLGQRCQYVLNIYRQGENRMRCQSVKVKVSNSLWHFIRGRMAFDRFFKGRAVQLEIVSKSNKIIINNNIYNIIIIYNILYIIINHIKCRISTYAEMQFDTLTLTL